MTKNCGAFTGCRVLILGFVFVLWESSLAGCAIVVPTDHVVMFNGLGNPVDPNGNFFDRHVAYIPFVNYAQLDDDQYEQQVDRIMEALRQHKPDKMGKRKILLFVHGGLTTAMDSLTNAERLFKEMTNTRTDYFPIFVNWESSFHTSYFDHLFNIRQGRPVFDWCCDHPPLPDTAKAVGAAIVGTATMPFYLAADIVRGLIRAPVVWYSLLFRRDQVASVEAVEAQADPGVIAISKGQDVRGYWERFTPYARTLIPTKPLSSMVIDAGGTSAWDNMIRRTHTLFHTDKEFTSSSKEAQPRGGLYRFVNRLRDEIYLNGDADKWDITLVGHSMGTIVLNEMIRTFGDQPCDQSCAKPDERRLMPFNTIIYMAAACNIREYQDSVFPYLLSNVQAQVYHLTLHPEAEVNEINFGGLAVDGSLLVWIDEFLSNPSTPLDLVAGRYTNLIATVQNTPITLRGRIHIKTFTVGNRVKDREPQNHGSFNDMMFWQSEFWQPQGHR